MPRKERAVNEEQALVAAIRADPNDNTRRLAFADWLDEHDQPERAAWMRDIEIFWWMGPDYVSPLPQILKQLRHKDPIERDKAGPIVERLRGAAALMLRAAFATRSRKLRRGIAEIFSWVRDGIPRSLPELIEDARSEDEDTARIAVAELDWHGPAAAPAVPVLVEVWERWQAIDDDHGGDYPVCKSIAQFFERIGPSAIEAAPLLALAFRAEDDLTEFVRRAIKAVRPAAVSAKLGQLLNDPTRWLQQLAIVAFSREMFGSLEAERILRDVVNNPDINLADAARQTFKTYGIPLA
jgi:uncharacterized protein (TIGR02996 family)